MFQQLFKNMPDVVKNLLILNLLFYLATFLFEFQGISLIEILGMHYPASEDFEPYQAVTYMFMHGGLFHIFFNMYALVLFGSRLEMVWGPKRFLLFYFVTGIGALILHIGVSYFRVQDLLSSLGPEEIEYVKEVLKHKGSALISKAPNLTEETFNTLGSIYHTPMVGASGAIFGVLIGFAMLFPNTELMLIFIPIPIKAKYFIGFYVIVELYLGYTNNPGDNVAHFAHLGGALIGFIMVMIWKRNKQNFY